MEDVLSRTNKVVVDVQSGNNLMLLPLDKMTAGSTSPGLSNRDNVFSEITGNIQTFTSNLGDAAKSTSEPIRRDTTRSRERR